jgi:hypothetical protein
VRYFERQSGERERTYRKFCTYRDLGPERSFAKASRILGVTVSALSQLSRKYDWQSRVQAYDDHLEMTRQAAIEKYEREQARDLVEGRKQIQQRILNAERRFLDRVEQMLEAEPFFTQEIVEVDEDGTPRVILNRYPAKWTYATLVAAFKVLDDSPSKRAMDAQMEAHEWGEDSASIQARAVQYFEQLGEEVRQKALEANG